MRHLFYYDFLLEEEAGVSIYTDMQSDIEGKVSLVRVSRIPVERTFSAFLDGTMKLYRVGYAGITGTPLYISPISVALMLRDEAGRLHRSKKYSTTFTLVLFPFEAYSEFLKKNSREVLSILLEDFKRNLRRKLEAKSSLIEGQKLEGERNVEVRRSLFSGTDFWIISDTSITGIYTKGRPAIQEEELFNPNKVKEVARARARYFMGLAEFYSGFRYLKENPGAYLMMDGAFYPYKRVGNFFGIGKDEYQSVMCRAVSFIKHPQKVPSNELVGFLAEYSLDKVLFWKGCYSEKEVEEEEYSGDREIFDFALMNFRGSGSFNSPANLIKLQFSDLSIEDVVNMVWHERNPLPTDRRRIYIEPYPIQIAEEVAKASLPSEDRIRGFVLSLVPPVPV